MNPTIIIVMFIAASTLALPSKYDKYDGKYDNKYASKYANYKNYIPGDINANGALAEATIFGSVSGNRIGHEVNTHDNKERHQTSHSGSHNQQNGNSHSYQQSNSDSHDQSNKVKTDIETKVV